MVNHFANSSLLLVFGRPAAPMAPGQVDFQLMGSAFSLRESLGRSRTVPLGRVLTNRKWTWGALRRTLFDMFSESNSLDILS
jgi:hypothetical protein